MKAAIALLLLSLIVLTGCAAQEAVEDTSAQAAPEATAEETAGELDSLVIEETQELEIGEML